MSKLRAVLKFSIFFVLCLIVSVIQPLILLVHKGKGAYILPKIWQSAVCKIFQIKVDVDGHISSKEQTLFVSNHISYLDIPVIGRLIKGSFIAKKDVEDWPVFGFLSKLQQTIFISRDREDAAKSKKQLDDALKAKKNLIVFPEGTSTEGVGVLPFKSSLFAITMQDNAKNLMIQPFTIKILEVDGRCPENQDDRDLYAWHVNMDTPLAEHLWRFAKTKGATIKLVFHPPSQANEFENRKTLAKYCHNAVSNGLGNRN